MKSNMGFCHSVMQYTTVILSQVGYKDPTFTEQGRGKAK